MSLYNTLFGMNPASNVLLKMAGLTMDEIPRFRDVSVDAGEIVVYTRTGGGNRECYADDGDCSACYHTANSALANKPNYLNDTDDDFDSTYAYFRFAPLDEYKELLAAITVKDETVGYKFKGLLEKLSKTR